jgi:hypothetical protein
MSPEAQAEMDALRVALEKMEAAIDALTPNERKEKMHSLRMHFAAQGVALMREDESVIALFEDGNLSFHHLAVHFHGRLPPNAYGA